MTYEAKLVQAGMWDTLAKQVAGGDVQIAITALGATQATATPITGDIVQVTVAAAATGVQLAQLGSAYVQVFNGAANAVLVYPPVGSTINAGAANAGFSIPAGKAASFVTGDGIFWIAHLSA